MKKLARIISLLIVLISCWLNAVIFWGGNAQLENKFLKNEIYPSASLANSSLTDLKFKIRGPQKPKNKIVIVEIDSPSIDQWGRWPWHRDQVAKIVERIFGLGASTVGLDVIFSEPDVRVPEPLRKVLEQKNLQALMKDLETDLNLAGTIARHQNDLILGWATDSLCTPKEFSNSVDCPVDNPEAIATHQEGFDHFSINKKQIKTKFEPLKTSIPSAVTLIANLDLFSVNAKKSGHLNAVIDSDGVIRKSSLIIAANKNFYPSLALKTAESFLKGEIELQIDDHSNIESIQIKNPQELYKIPANPSGVVEINFRGPQQTFPYVSALDLMSDSPLLTDELNQKLTGQNKSEIFKNAIVLIGISAIGVGDRRTFPYDYNVPGVEGHATIIDNILSQDFIRTIENRNQLFMLLAFMLAGGLVIFFIADKLESVRALVIFSFLVFILFCVDVFSFSHEWNLPTAWVYIEFIVLFVSVTGFKYFEVEKSKNFMKQAFSRYVSPEIVGELLRNPEKLTLGGEKKELTILFSDIRGFTSFSENMDAKDLSSFLNKYLAEMTRLVFENRGTLDKYIGDAVMVFWGAPVENPKHAADALWTALKMQESVVELRPLFQSQWGIDLQIGIGVCTGVVNVGNMGSAQNFEYTVIGDKVNLTARLESLTKSYDTKILTTKETIDQALQSKQFQLYSRFVDCVRVKGKKDAVAIYEASFRPFSEEGIRIYLEAFELYKNRKWEQARSEFAKAQKIFGDQKGPCATFQDRCLLLQKDQAKDSDWDGIWNA